MSIFTRLFSRNREERAATLANPPDWLVEAFVGGAESYSGKIVGLTSAMGLIPVWAAVNLVAGSVGSLPMIVYRHDGDRRVRDEGSRAWTILHEKPNPEMAADELWEMVQAHLCTWGNAFLWKESASDGLVWHLWPLDPPRVRVTRLPDGTRLFDVDGRGIPFTETDILHFRALSQDGTVGYSPIQTARQGIGSMLAQQEFQGRFWANDASPGVVLKHPNKLNEEGQKKLKATWDAAHRGPARARGTAVLEEGMDIKQMTMPLEDAQFVEQAKMTRTDAALLFGVPPYMLAGDSGGTTLQYSTSEGHSLDFVKWSLRRRLVRIERTVARDGDLTLAPQYPEFLVDALLRASTKERNEAYALADYMTVNEKRRRENLDPVDGGDVVPALNMTSGGDDA